MKKTEVLSALGDNHLSYKGNPFYPAEWEDSEGTNNANNLVDAMPELQALAAKALAQAVKDGLIIQSISRLLPPGISPAMPNELTVMVEPEEYTLYKMSDRGRASLLTRMFATNEAEVDYTVRRNGKGLSLGFEIPVSAYLSALRPSTSWVIPRSMDAHAILRDAIQQKIFLNKTVYHDMNPDEINTLNTLFKWFNSTFPSGKSHRIRIPMENLLPSEFSELDSDGSANYALAGFRDSSCFLTVELTADYKKDGASITGWSNQLGDYLMGKYRPDVDTSKGEQYITLHNVTDKDLFQYAPYQAGGILSSRINSIKTKIFIEVDLDAVESSYISHGSNDVLEMGDYLQYLVRNTSTGDPVPYHYVPVDFNSAVKPRTGLADTLVSPYNLMPIYVPPNDPKLMQSYKAAQAEAYLEKDGNYRLQRNLSSFDMNELASRDLGITESSSLHSVQHALAPKAIIGVDWLANVLLYGDGRSLTSVDLSDFSPTRAYHLMRYSDNNVYASYSGSVYNVLNRIMRVVLLQPSTRKQVASQELVNYLPQVFKVPQNEIASSLELTWDNYVDNFKAGNIPEPSDPTQAGFIAAYQESRRSGDEIVDLSEFAHLKAVSYDSSLPFNRLVAMAIRDFADWALKDLNKAYKATDLTVTNFLQMLGFARVWETLFLDSKTYISAKAAFDAETVGRQPDEFKQLPKGYSPAAVPNIRDDRFLLPHQAKVNYSLEQNKQFNLIEVSAGGGKCLTGDALVPTSKGLLTLKEVFESHSYGQDDERLLEGLKVFTKEGAKEASGSYTTKGKTYKVMLSNGSLIEGLPEHKLWVLRNGEFEFVRLDELKAGDSLPRYGATGLFGRSTSLKHIRINPSEKAKQAFKAAKCFLPTHMTGDLAELLGWVVSEGSGTNGNAVTQHHDSNRKRIRKLARKLFGKKSIVNPNNDYGVSFTKSVSLFISELVGNGLSMHRYIPVEVRKAPKEMVARFLSALFEGDGTIYLANKGSSEEPKFGGYLLEYTTISKELAQQVLVMLENFGIEAGVASSDKYESQGGTTRVYTVYVNRASHALFEQEIGFISAEKRKLLRTAVNYRFSVEGTNNDVIFGIENRYPVGKELNRLFKQMEKALNGVTLYSEYANRFGGATRRPVEAKLKHIHSLARSNGASHSWGEGTRYLYGLNDNGWTNTWTIQRLNDCYDALPSSAKANLPSDFTDRLAAVNELTKYSWLSVVSVRKGRKVKRVYDICVPGPHEYSVQTIMSHNTALAVTDILKKLKEGVTKVPAVFCPGHLLANYVQDANYFTDGKVNVIPLRTETYNRLGAEYFEQVAKGKPINTFFVIDYDFARQEWDETYVGNQVIGFYPRAQWLRSLGIDAVWLDEAHYLKNDSARTQAMREALIDVKRITLMTGTFYPTRAADIVNQTMLWDTGLFGYSSTFDNMFGLGDTLSEYTRQYINKVLTDNVCVARAKRKEWAALLPDRQVAFHKAELTNEARNVYDAILTATLEEIKKDPVIMKLLAKADTDEDYEANLEGALNRYLQRLEKAITCPYQDKLWQEEWGIVSPKLSVVETICRNHLKKKTPGKILIFCSYHSSVDAIYDNMSPDLKRLTLRYSAATKEADRAKFENDDDVQIMIGIENSMNTGINAQFASRLIRIDSIYSPGQLEQGESRVCRPNLKVEEFRNMLYFDWVLASETYDATKTARLISKILDVEKFNNMSDVAYQGLKDLPVLRLSFDIIAQSSNFDEELHVYLEEYMRLENVIKVKEIKDYRSRNPNLTPIPLKSDGLLKGSRLMKHVPYIPLGGVPSTVSDQMEVMDEVLRNTEDPKSLVGSIVHTEYGEGTIKRVNKDTVTVEVPSAGRITLPQQTVYLMTTPKTRSTRSIKEQMAKAADLALDDGLALSTEEQDASQIREKRAAKDEQVAEETPVAEKKAEKPQKTSPVPQDVEDGEVELYPTLVNEFYALVADETSDWEEATGNDLADYGFVATGPIMYMQLTRWQHCVKLREAWKASGFLAPKSFYEALNYLEGAMKAKRADLLTFRHLQRSVKDLMVWSLQKRKKLKNDRARPYFVIQEGDIYVMIDRNSTPAWPKIKTAVRVPGAKWFVEDTSRWYVSTKRTDIVKVVKQMIKDGVPLTEVEDLKQNVTALKNLIR